MLRKIGIEACHLAPKWRCFQTGAWQMSNQEPSLDLASKDAEAAGSPFIRKVTSMKAAPVSAASVLRSDVETVHPLLPHFVQSPADSQLERILPIKNYQQIKTVDVPHDDSQILKLRPRTMPVGHTNEISVRYREGELQTEVTYSTQWKVGTGNNGIRLHITSDHACGSTMGDAVVDQPNAPQRVFDRVASHHLNLRCRLAKTEQKDPSTYFRIIKDLKTFFDEAEEDSLCPPTNAITCQVQSQVGLQKEVNKASCPPESLTKTPSSINMKLTHQEWKRQNGSRKTNVFLALGSNMGNAIENIETACRRLRGSGLRITRTSQLYQSSPMYVEEQRPFVNAVCEVCEQFTNLSRKGLNVRHR